MSDEKKQECTQPEFPVEIHRIAVQEVIPIRASTALLARGWRPALVWLHPEYPAMPAFTPNALKKTDPDVYAELEAAATGLAAEKEAAGG